MPAVILIVHGYDGSGPGHWQHWLATTLAERGTPVSFPNLPSPCEPDCGQWTKALSAEIDAAAARGPVVLIAHSLGCWAVDHVLSSRGAAGVRAALLVAPPSPYSLFEPIQSFLPPPQNKNAWAPIAAQSLLVGSDNDDYAAPDEHEDIARALGLRLHHIPGAGHINAAAGFGPWPFALEFADAALR